MNGEPLAPAHRTFIARLKTELGDPVQFTIHAFDETDLRKRLALFNIGEDRIIELTEVDS